MIAYCWATGLIEFGNAVPKNAIEIARGNAKKLRMAIGGRARHGKGNSAGLLLVPGVPEARSQAEKGDALALWLMWCVQRPEGLQWNAMAASPSPPQTTEIPHVHA